MTDIYLGQLLKEKKSAVTLAQVYQYYREHADEFRIEDEAKSGSTCSSATAGSARPPRPRRTPSGSGRRPPAGPTSPPW